MTTGDGNRVAIVDLGHLAFDAAVRLMREAAESIRAGRSPGKVLFVEHPSVYTAGRATPPSELVPGAVPVDRGGRLTWHGPGQLVVYPVLPLVRRDVRAWLRALERFGIAVCRRFGLDAQASLDGTGVFVGERKVASIGVAIRHWISTHGIAINVAIEPAAFTGIRPCGRSPEIMSDLSSCAGRTLTVAAVRSAAEAELSVLLEAAGTPSVP